MAINMFVHVHLQFKYVHLIKDLIVINLYQNQYILIKKISFAHIGSTRLYLVNETYKTNHSLRL